MNTQEKIEYIADYYGWGKQYMMVVEEMSELTKAICKHRRMWGRNPEGHLIPSKERDAMLEEAADVQVMLYQAAYLLRAEEEIGRIVEGKLDRQIGIIEEEKGKRHVAGVYPVKDDMPRYKGFLILKCQHCGKIHAFCAKYSISYLKCRECGGKTELVEPLLPAYVKCDCGRSSRYLTNLTDPVIEVECIKCQEVARLRSELQVLKERDTSIAPVKDSESGVRYTDVYVCTRCGKHFTGTGIAQFCYHCGQRLKWEE